MLIFSLCLLLFINAMSIGLVFPIFAPLFTHSAQPMFVVDTALGARTFAYTLILAVPTFFMIFGAPLLGKLSDHFGRKKVLLTGLLGVAFSFLLSALAIFLGNLTLLFFSRAIAGFMDGSEPVAQAAIADLSKKEHKARTMGYATFAGTLGFIFGPTLGGFLAEPALTGRLNYEIPFIASLFLTLINALALYLFFSKEQSPPKQSTQISYRELLRKGFSICFDKRLRGLSLQLFVLQLILAAFFQLSTLVLVEKFHYSSLQVGLFTTFLGAFFSGGIFFVIHVLLPRVNHLHLLKVGMGLALFAVLAALSLHNTSLLAWVSVVPLMLGIAMMYNVLLSFVSNAVSEKEQGDAMGGGTALKACGWLISSLLVGGLYPHVVAILVVMLVFVAVALFGTRWVKNV